MAEEREAGRLPRGVDGQQPASAIGNQFLSRQRVASQVLPTAPGHREPPWQSGNPTSHRSESFSMSSVGSGDPVLQYTQQKRDISCVLRPRPFFCEAYYNDERQQPEPVAHWRIQQRTRSVAMGMILALHLRVVPPGAPPSPRAKEEGWVVPSRKKLDKDIEQVAAHLKDQLLSLCPRSARSARSFMFKQAQDPPVEKVKSMCTYLRSFAKDKRIIMHYNGHGVPKPSDNGEVWVFNRGLTQYIPLSLFDLQNWLRGPSLYIFDCARGALILKWLAHFAVQHKDDYQRALLAHSDGEPIPTAGADNYFAIVACGMNETLPSNPDLPADLLTACLTTPVQMSLRWCYHRSLLRDQFQGATKDTAEVLEWIMKVPGHAEDRQTPLGELNWIFTSITEAIAWELVPAEQFQTLFREDPVVASLFRNFLLADRILRDAECTPQTYPSLPRTHYHPMWKTWDQVLDIFLEQLPRVVRQPKAYQPSCFFTDHLTAFEVWLDFAEDDSKHPRELPILLQALLSPTHRLRALELFRRFLDLGVWAVNLALSVGVFHYVLRLLQRASGPSVPLLIFIWTKIIAADHSLQEDLIKAEAHLFFLQVLRSTEHQIEDRVRACFILSVIMDEYPTAQSVCLRANLVPICSALLIHPHAPLRHWALICIGKVVEANEVVKHALIGTSKIQELFLQKIHDNVAENRAAALYAIGNFIAAGPTEDDCEIDLALSMKAMAADINPSVRRELVTALSYLVSLYVDQFCLVALAIAKMEVLKSLSEAEKEKHREVLASDFGRLWRVLYSIQFDPLPLLSSAANRIVIRVHSLVQVELMKDSANAEQADAMHQYFLSISNLHKAPMSTPLHSNEREKVPSTSFRQQLKQTWRLSHRRTPSGASEHAAKHQTSAGFTPLQMGTVRRSIPVASGQPPPSPQQPRTADHRHSDSHKSGARFHVQRSRFFDWACESFNAPSLDKDEEEVAPIKQWKKLKTEKFLQSMEDVRMEVGSQKIESQLAALTDDHQSFTVSGLVLHPFYPVVVASGGDDIVRVWDWKEKALVGRFSNTNPPGTAINSMSVVNLMEESDFLLVSSSDGVVRLWRTYYQSNPSLITAWRAHKQPHPLSAMIHLWKQNDGIVLTAGEHPVMRMWDVDHGIAVQDIPTGTNHALTCLAQESPSGPLVVAGDAEGALRVFDCRVSSRSSLIKTYTEHTRSVIGVEMLFDSVKIVSGSVAGDVRLFDLRTSSSVDTIQAHIRSEMTSLSVHRQAPIIATGTHNQTIKITNHNGQRLNDIKYYSKYLGQRIGSVSALQFHEYTPLLAVGNTDGVVAVYQSPGVHEDWITV